MSHIIWNGVCLVMKFLKIKYLVEFLIIKINIRKK